MQFGSIHPDEHSARRAMATLIRAGIEPERVRIIGPRPPRPGEEQFLSGKRLIGAWLRDLAGGIGLGGAVGTLACAVLALFATPFLVRHAMVACAILVLSAAVAGGAAAILVHGRYAELAGFVYPRPRQTARGWALVVHARDADQRALAARALASTLTTTGPVAA